MPRAAYVAVGLDMALLQALVEQRTAGDRRYRHAACPVQRSIPGAKRRGQGRSGALMVLVDQQGERDVVVAGGTTWVAGGKRRSQIAGPPPQVNRLVPPRSAIRLQRGSREGVPLPLGRRVAHVRTARRPRADRCNSLAHGLTHRPFRQYGMADAPLPFQDWTLRPKPISTNIYQFDHTFFAGPGLRFGQIIVHSPGLPTITHISLALSRQFVMLYRTTVAAIGSTINRANWLKLVFALSNCPAVTVPKAVRHAVCPSSGPREAPPAMVCRGARNNSGRLA